MQPDARPDAWGLSRREIALVAAFWTVLAVLSILNRLADPRGPGVHLLPPSAPVILILFESALWTALTPIVFALARRFTLRGTGWVWRVPLLLAVGLVLAALTHLAVEVLRVEVLEVPRRRFGAMPSIQPLRFLNDFIIYVAVLAAGFAREYYLRYEARNREAARLTAEAAALQAQLAESRLAALRMQLNPHFLFNTLHAVSALVERDPSGVRRMIARLGELLRETLDEKGEAERTLEREMAFIERYLEIMQVRFQGKLEVEMAVDAAARRALVPALILQPLVENAIKHGLAGDGGRGRLEIGARRSGDRVVLSVRDDGPGPLASPVAGGVGLSNTRARLQQMYGAAQRLTLRAHETAGTVAEVELPYREAPPDEAAVGPR
jgi:two-component sensor histidine kinase